MKFQSNWPVRALRCVFLGGGLLALMGVDGDGCSVEDGEEPQPTACFADDDCADGLVCNAADVCLPPPGCEDPDVACPAVCYGECVEPSEPADEGCYGDQDCEGGLVCNAAEVCLSPPGCNPGEPCPAVCYGECVEPPTR